MGKFKGAIFDLDGVVVNTVPLHFKAWKKMFSEYGKRFSFEDYKQKVDGIPRMDGARAILTDLPEKALCEAASKKQSYFLSLVETEGVEVYKTTLGLIKELKANQIKVAVCSSSKNCPLILKSSGIYDLFDAEVNGTHITRGKPDPEMFLLGAEKVGLDPGDCIGFEDAKLGIQAVKAAGMVCVGIDRHGDPGRLVGADLIIGDLGEVDYNRLELLYKKIRGLR